MLPTPELERSVSYRFGTAEGGQSKKNRPKGLDVKLSDHGWIASSWLTT